MATDAPVLAVTRAIAKDGDVRRGHGLEVRFEGVRVDPAPFGDFKIDVIGPAFRGLRPAYRMLAQALLPFAVHRMSAADVIGACARGRCSTCTHQTRWCGALVGADHGLTVQPPREDVRSQGV